MDIGVPAEIKTAEKRIGLTPSAVSELTGLGHNVVVDHGDRERTRGDRAESRVERGKAH